MVRTLRILALVLATGAALQLGDVSSAGAAAAPPSTDVGAARVARVLFRRVQPWILVIIQEMLDCSLTLGGASSPPSPAEPLLDDPDDAT